MRRLPIFLALVMLALAEPAMAATAVPEPTDFALFLLGVAGLIIGRRSARARHAPPGDDGTA